jgi:hypothetical protein
MSEEQLPLGSASEPASSGADGLSGPAGVSGAAAPLPPSDTTGTGSSAARLPP